MSNEEHATLYELSADDLARVERDYIYHLPTEDQVIRYRYIRNAAKDFAVMLMASCPKSRELSLALTHLDGVVMFANAAIARNETTNVT